MDYWISCQNEQMGPYSFEQLELMWQQGQLTSDTYYFESIRAEWLLLETLFESNRQLFTAEEAFVRVGQNRQNGCLIVFNRDEELHLFAENGFIIAALGSVDHGELALARALHLEEASYEWFLDAKPDVADLHINIHEYALKNAIARDVRVGGQSQGKKHTVALPKIALDRIEPKLKFTYVLVAQEAPTKNWRLMKATNVLGREDHCDLMVEDAQVSRKHCLLEASEQNVKVKDLESRNGISVNGVPTTDGYLNVGDRLSLGSYVLVLQKEQKRAPEVNA